MSPFSTNQEKRDRGVSRRSGPWARGDSLGFTLLEMMIAIGISMVAIGAGAAALVTQYQSTRTADLIRAGVATDRYAMTHMESKLRLAGYGIDPALAFDFYTPGIATGCTVGPPCRDFVNQPDELMFLSRNPLYRYRPYNTTVAGQPCNTQPACYDGNVFPVVSASATTLTLTSYTNVTFEEGRVLEILCANAQSPTLVTLMAPGVSATGTPTAGNSVTVNLSPTAIGNPYTQALPTCATQPGALAFLVDRHHYYVQDPGDGGTPWLMYDTGLWSNSGGDRYPVAKNVKDMQVAYVLTPNSNGAAPDTNANWVIGDDPTKPEQPKAPTGPPYKPTYGTPLTDPSTFGTGAMAAGNIRGVRVELRIQSDGPDLTQSIKWAGDKVNSTENNANQVLSVKQHHLYTAETDIHVRNMEATTPSF
jgi:type IV pilus assembly protein PilW